MEIMHKGEDRTYKIECKTCNSILKYKNKDVMFRHELSYQCKYFTNNRKIKYITCPHTGHEIIIYSDDEIKVNYDVL